jgi:hypothetical protein
MILLGGNATSPPPAFIIGASFRGTAAFVTDQPNCYPALKTTIYPTAAGGTNFGFLNTNPPNDAVDRVATNDPRVAGVAYGYGTDTRFQIDLPASGTYTINMAVGDPGGGSPSDIEIWDGTTNSTVLLHVTQPGGQFADAHGTLYADAASWVAANPVGGLGPGGIGIVFASAKCTIAWLYSSSYDVFSHFMIQSA